MKTYKEYYKKAKERELKWLYSQKDEWWKTGDRVCKEFDIRGDYIESVSPLFIDEKNDVSLFVNHTNVKNMEWSILMSMLGQALVDFLIERKRVHIWSYYFKIDRIVDGTDNVYETSFNVKVLNKDNTWRELKRIDKLYEECACMLCDIVDTFISQHEKDIPCDWKTFSFSLDSLMDSCAEGCWSISSDGHLSMKDSDMNEYVMSM